MKSGPKRDFAVQVRKQEDDEDGQLAKFYRGIFSVNLNFLVSIMFIPEFARTDQRWYLDVPDDVDIVHSSQEARLFTAALADYTVTPDDSRAGTEELIPIPHPPPPIPDFGPKMGVIFYVTTEQFRCFSQELAMIEERTFSVYGSFPLSNLKGFEYIQFIFNKVITSEHFSEGHLSMLGRQKRASRQAGETITSGNPFGPLRPRPIAERALSSAGPMAKVTHVAQAASL